MRPFQCAAHPFPRTVIFLAAVLGILGCQSAVRFGFVRFEPGSPSLEGEATTVERMRAIEGAPFRIARDGITVQSQVGSAYIAPHINPGIQLTLLIENDSDATVSLVSDEMIFSRFPPYQEPAPEGTPLESVTVVPSTEEKVAAVPAHTTAKVHLAYPSPARTPGYMNLVLRREDTGVEYVYIFKVKRK